MRNFPASTDFSDNQRSIYQAHPESAMLIIGPPGTGKTVLAIHRAKKICETKINLKMLMFNETLMLYTKAQTSDDHLFKRNVVKLHTYLIDKFRNIIGGYRSYKGYADFNLMLRLFNQSNDINQKAKLFNEALFIDEGQDFPNEFYQLLADYWVFAKKNKIKFYPTVMADENQRIKKDENTTIQEMEDIFGAIPGALDLYQKRLLNENYRNTKEIAEVGRRFYPGLKTGVPEIPSKRGDKPTFFWVNSRTELAERIINYKVNNPTKTVGVLIPQQGSGKPVEKYVVALRQILKKRAINQKKIFVQYYLSKHREINTEDLNFDSSNSITVLTNQSAKGLEFDAVFIPDLEQLDTVGEFFGESMTFYVLLHRARDNLFLCAINNKNNLNLPPILSQQHKTQDSEKNIHKIGFQNQAELEKFIEIEGSTAISEKPKKIYKPESTNQSTHESRVKIDLGGKGKSDSKISPKELFKKYIINPEKNTKYILDYSKNYSRKDQEELLLLIKGFKNQKSTPKKKTNSKKITSTLHENNIKKRSHKNQPSKTILSYVSGNSDAPLLRLMDVIKSVIKEKGETEFNIISTTEDPQKICSNLISLLNKNRDGFTKTFFTEIKNDSVIKFVDYHGRENRLNILNPNMKINFTKSSFFIGLENIREAELNADIGDSVGTLLLKIMLENRPITEFIFPDLGDFDIPSVKFIMDNYDDGSLKEKKYDY